MVIPMPSLEVQGRVASHLSQAFKLVDVARLSAEERLAAAEALRRELPPRGFEGREACQMGNPFTAGKWSSGSGQYGSSDVHIGGPRCLFVRTSSHGTMAEFEGRTFSSFEETFSPKEVKAVSPSCWRHSV